MKYVIFVVLVLLGLTFILTQDASAQVAGNKAYSLTGNGFGVHTDSVSTAGIDLLFTTTKIQNKIGFLLQSGTIVVDDKELEISSFSGTILKEGKLFRISSMATDLDGKQFTVSVLGRLIHTTPTDSIYSLTGTITDPSKKATKLILTTKLSEFALETTEASRSSVTVKILEGAANPTEVTYKDQVVGFRFNFFSEDRITIVSGGTITFVNEDTVSHSLKSGTANRHSRHDPFTADGKISSDEIQPGESWNVKFDTPGFYRLFDENYQWMNITIFVTTDSSSQTIGTNVKPIN
jgi:plastocyanin